LILKKTEKRINKRTYSFTGHLFTQHLIYQLFIWSQYR